LRRRIDSGATIVFVSHGDAQIRQVCNRALWIEQGRSMLQGDVDSVLAAYPAAPHAPAAAAPGA
jgi:ABC-type polysaccharide/polyol phosphate transport system ATPase subunit